jgi:hypothetical protein
VVCFFSGKTFLFHSSLNILIVARVSFPAAFAQLDPILAIDVEENARPCRASLVSQERAVDGSRSCSRRCRVYSSIGSTRFVHGLGVVGKEVIFLE